MGQKTQLHCEPQGLRSDTGLDQTNIYFNIFGPPFLAVTRQECSLQTITWHCSGLNVGQGCMALYVAYQKSRLVGFPLIADGRLPHLFSTYYLQQGRNFCDRWHLSAYLNVKQNNL